MMLLWMSVSGCSSDKPQSQPDNDKVLISAAKQAYQKHCSGCHVPPSPDALEGQAWAPVIERMLRYHAAKALPPITKGDKALIMNYLIEGQGR